LKIITYAPIIWKENIIYWKTEMEHFFLYLNSFQYNIILNLKSIAQNIIHRLTLLRLFFFGGSFNIHFDGNDSFSVILGAFMSAERAHAWITFLETLCSFSNNLLQIWLWKFVEHLKNKNKMKNVLMGLYFSLEIKKFGELLIAVHIK